MNKKLLSCLFWVCLALLPLGLFGQDLMKIANKQFQLDAYDLALQNYKKVLAVNPLNNEAMFNLAECYRITKSYDEALGWYDHLMKMDDFDSKAILHYGHVLKSLGKFENAKFWYYKYMEFDQEVGRHFAESCDKALVLLEKEDAYDLSLFPANTELSDFGVSFIGDKTVFCSFRNDVEKTLETNNGNSVGYAANQLYQINDDGEVTYLRERMVSSYHIGPVSYSGADMNLIAYSRNNFKNGVDFVRANDAHLSLFLADKLENSNDFNKERPFPFNETGFSTGFPNFADNGATLYFASNRPGGFGGYDIYVSYYKDNKWSIPLNLGKEVNSSGNEITPFFDEKTGRLYFSSDYHAGLGGFDVFACEYLGTTNYGPAINVGKGINSPSDDYYFVMDKMTNDIYFTSNRIGGSGADDIYKARAIMEEIAAEDIPQAVNLRELEIGTSTAGSTTVSEISDEVPAYLADNNFSMADARMVAKGTLLLDAPPSKVYFVQVAALYKSKGNLDMFDGLTSFGNLYKVHKSSSTKIRLGYYTDRNEATKILSRVKGMGYNDAFIVEESLELSELELVGNSKSGNASSEISSTYMPSSKVSNYKVRLASYTDPLWFDIGRVKDLGDIEQWTKGQYTIFILSGYGNLDNAQKAMIKAKNRGFTDAHIVVDNNGYLEKLKEN